MMPLRQALHGNCDEYGWDRSLASRETHEFSALLDAIYSYHHYHIIVRVNARGARARFHTLPSPSSSSHQCQWLWQFANQEKLPMRYRTVNERTYMVDGSVIVMLHWLIAFIARSLLHFMAIYSLPSWTCAWYEWQCDIFSRKFNTGNDDQFRMMSLAEKEFLLFICRLIDE